MFYLSALFYLSKEFSEVSLGVFSKSQSLPPLPHVSTLTHTHGVYYALNVTPLSIPPHFIPYIFPFFM
jgi:hypothetical protein